ncbi:MAG: hypothetical protein DRQ99_07330 [Candidatus Parabeggiatoa sp. nov. 3]|nr:MAG: hypothetical protein DRQ99_07330 [Gammaproteobacteria bacterium]
MSHLAEVGLAVQEQKFVTVFFLFATINYQRATIFIEIISLLAATPNNLLILIREGGGITEWLWKGSASPIASV